MSERRHYDLVVIGAGPAGLAGAVGAAELGLSVLLLDEQPRPGGQIYRDVERTSQRRPRIAAALGPDYAAGLALVEALRQSAVEYLPGASIWQVSAEREVAFSREGHSAQIQAGGVLIATGALERAVPIPGWTLPGVMGAGAVQTMLKQGLLPDVPVVLAGCGPLLLLLANQLLRLGVRPVALVDTAPAGRLRQALPQLPAALRASGYLRKGLALQARLRLARLPIVTAATELAVDGDERVTGLGFTAGGERRQVNAELVVLHEGVVPNVQLGRALGCAHHWDEGQRCFVPTLDAWLRTDRPGIAIAGDGGGIGGAVAAALRGRLAAVGMALALGRLTKRLATSAAAPIRRALARDTAVRPCLETLFAPTAASLDPPDDAILCRCEEVSAGDLRAAVRQGCPGPNGAKAFLRCGMGPCQGRLCGLPVSEVIASTRGVTREAVGYYRLRPPIKPLTLGELARMHELAGDWRGDG